MVESTRSRIESEPEVKAYIKIRVELLGLNGNATTFVMSFHFAEKIFMSEMFPYKKARKGAL